MANVESLSGNSDSGSRIENVLANRQPDLVSDKAPSWIRVSKTGSLLVVYDSELRFLFNSEPHDSTRAEDAGTGWQCLQTTGQIRAASFSPDGSLVYAWSRHSDQRNRKTDYWYVWELQHLLNDPRICVKRFVSDASREVININR